MPVEDLAEKGSEWGFDSQQLACWGDHYEVDRAMSEDGCVQGRLDLLAKCAPMACYAIGAHLVGQCVCDPNETCHQVILPPYIWGDGDPEGVRQRAAEELKNAARAARTYDARRPNWVRTRRARARFSNCL